ncbi:uncharacterized protein LOC129296279 [Prosopis cineraria]|uniref:uncharacterized protein LOC129296279 n=1 Tax=Prosopis cineraria TaxID=364024 RepID=UPI0024108007|nr:uncharacterized protein LOC129296279 [Prosopis cineraria]
MESNSREKLFCFFHCGGEFVRSADSGMKYEGGNVIVRTITKGMKYAELRSFISSEVCHGDNGNDVKFTVEIDSSTFIDLLDDVGVEQLFEYNGRTAHVYVAKWAALEDDPKDIKGFMEGARPILYIDGSFMSGPYKGTLLSACAYDADNEMFPVAYAVVSGETVEEWSWQAFCYRHVKENFGSEFLKVTRGKRKNGVIKDVAFKLLDAIAYARLTSEFNVAMSNMMNFCPDLLQWLETHGDIDRWALSKFSHRRWDNIMTNIAESFNSWVVKERKYNIAVFMYEHREKLTKKLHNSKVALKKWTNGVGPNVETKLKENVLRGDTLQADFYALNTVRVKTLNGDVRVNLELRECSCLAWQMSGLPCPHACAAIKLSHGNIYQYVEEWYHLSCQEKIYGSNMIPIETFDIPKPDTATLTDNLSQTFLQPPLTSRPPRRPRIRRIEF